jgi:ubiquinone/menaquinone biosynthesis C-methylase UbiE
MWRHRSLSPPFRLHAGDFTRTSFPDNSVDVAVSISAIEHGVDLKAFLKEVRRILSPQGCLVVTTDYWEEEIQTNPSLRAFGAPLKVFSRDDIEVFLRLAEENGLIPLESAAITPCVKRTVHWQQADYTFIALVLKRSLDRARREVNVGEAQGKIFR